MKKITTLSIIIFALVFSSNLWSNSSESLKIGDLINLGYQWRVLDIKDNEILVISEYLLLQRPYHSQRGDITWAECDLRTYLNTEFYNLFSPEAKKFIMKKTTKTNANPKYGTSGGPDVEDYFFILSIDEVIKYFVAEGCESSIAEVAVITDHNDSERVAKFESNVAKWWWLRSTGEDSSRVANITFLGRLYVNGQYADFKDGGVRPAMWLRVRDN
jgi:hypothetical protein